MKKLLIALLSFGFLLSLSSTSMATSVDVVEYPQPNFVPSGTTSPYLGAGEDWGWTHAIITEPIDTSAELLISAWDVDASSGEVDVISAYDADTDAWIVLGNLAGSNNSWAFTTFVLPSILYDEIGEGLQVFMEIDQGNAGWLVALAKSVITIDGGQAPNPNPGNAVPEPTTMVLFGFGLLGVAGIGRRKNS